MDFPSASYRTVQVCLRRCGGGWASGGSGGLCGNSRSIVHTTDSNHSHRVYPNLLPGRRLTDVNQAWGADFTYIRIANGFVYLAVILDLFSRQVIGWAISKHGDAELALAALRQAIAQRRPVASIIRTGACSIWVTTMWCC